MKLFWSDKTTLPCIASAALIALVLVPGSTFADISATYVPPAGKQGVGDAYYAGPALPARYSIFSQLGTSNKTYNMFWNAFESGTASSSIPYACPTGFVLTPSNEGERIAKGFKRYRCFSQAVIADTDVLLARDKFQGIQSTAILWNAPYQYRDANCHAALINSYDGAPCVPRDNAMDDWEDFVNFLADRYSQGSSIGKISHFIIWNENASGEWFDYSPTVSATSATLTAAQRNLWIQKYVSMLQRAHSALARRTSGVLMHVSTDANWAQPAFGGFTHIGTRSLLDGIWQSIGVSIDWSIAVHPYGDPVEAAASWNNFQNVANVSAYQLGQLRSRGISDPLSKPQMRFIASEQGWPQSVGIDVQARNICEAHAFATRTPSLVAVAHNEFQYTGPVGNESSSFGLVRSSAGADLSGASGMSTFEAYRSTSPSTWGAGDTHYCCTQHSLGCSAARAHTMSGATSNNTLWSAQALVDGDYGTAYSSNAFPTAQNTNSTVVRAYLPARAAGGWMVTTIKLHARIAGGVPVGFPKSYAVWVTDSTNASWVSVGTYTVQPDSAGVATLALPRAMRTYGITIQPIELATNAGGNYFQLAEIELIPSLGYRTAQPYPLGNTSSNNTQAGWHVANLSDGVPSTSYSSQAFATSANSNNTFVAAWIYPNAQTPTVRAVNLRARMSGSIALGFPQRYQVWLTSTDNSSWILAGEFSAQPDSTGVATVGLPHAYQTWGVRVIPLVLGTDDFGTYYFQLADLELLP